MKKIGALLVAVAVIGLAILLANFRVNPYAYFAGYVVLQYVVIATAWNMLGGYAGYVNFGTPAFFALGAYTAIFLIEAFKAPLPVLIALYHQLLGGILFSLKIARSDGRNGLTAIALIPEKAPVGAVSISAKRRP